MSLLAALVLALATAAPPLPDATLDAAHGLLARGHDALAEAEYRSFLDEHPDHADRSMAWYGLGVALFQQAKHGEAIAALRHLEDDARFPYAAEVGTMLGRAHLAEGRPELALAALESVVTRHGTHDLADDAGSAIVECHLAQGDHAAAIKAADEFATRWPQSSLRGRTDELAARAEMQLGRDRAGAERLARLGEDASPSRRLLLAQLWHRAGVTDRATDAYQSVLNDKKAGSLAADASSGLARLLHDTGRFDDAIRQIDRHLRRFEGNTADLRILAARCRLEKGDATQAVRAFQGLVKDDDVPGDESRYWLARSQLATGDAAAAERVLAEAVRRYPGSTLAPELKHDHAVALLRLARPDDALAVLATLKLPKKHRLTAPVALLQAQAQHHAGQYDGSAEGCRRLLAGLDPAQDTPLRTAATFLLIENDYLAGNLADAARGYTSFIETFPGAPERPQAELRLGLALVELGEADAARPWLIRSARRPEASAADAQLALADLAYAAARWDDARQAYDAFLERSGDADDVTAGARLRRALAARRLGDDRTASRELAALVKSGLGSPHRAAARYELGLLAQEAGDARNARRHFDAVLADDGETPYASRAAFANAGLVAAAGDARAAADLYADAARRATALGETSVADEAHFQQGQMLFAADAFADAAQAFAGVTRGPRTAEARARRAIALARADSAEATGALRAAEAREGLDPALRTAVLYELAWTYRKAGAEDDAIAAYERLLAQAQDDPRADHARIELADLALAGDDPARAASWLQPLLRKTESSVRPDALYRLGVAAFRQGDHSAAASHLEEYVAQVKTGPLLPAARLLAGEALATLGAHGRAVEMLEPIRRIDDVAAGTLDAALLRLGESYAALQQWAKSEQRFATHLDQFPEATRWAHARFGRGWARENQGRSKDAIADYEVVVAGHQGPLAARAQFQIGECLFAEKDLEAAVRALLKVDILYAYPEWSAAALYEAGRCFEGLGDLVQARTQFTQVTERYGDTDWARLAEARLTELQDSGLPGR